jgi:uncharacterized membrane protein
MKAAGCLTVVLICFLFGILLWNLFKYNLGLNPSLYVVLPLLFVAFVVTLVVAYFLIGR